MTSRKIFFIDTCYEKNEFYRNINSNLSFKETEKLANIMKQVDVCDNFDTPFVPYEYEMKIKRTNENSVFNCAPRPSVTLHSYHRFKENIR